jgi:hypothetical protein
MSYKIAFRDSFGNARVFVSDMPLHNKTQDELKRMLKEQVNIIARLPILVEVG